MQRCGKYCRRRQKAKVVARVHTLRWGLRTPVQNWTQKSEERLDREAQGTQGKAHPWCMAFDFGLLNCSAPCLVARCPSSCCSCHGS